MTNAEKGLLMLTCPLGDASITTMTYRQFHGLRKRMAELTCDCDKDLTESDLRAVGLPAQTAAQIVSLLDREVQLDAYLRRAEQYGITTVTRVHSSYPRFLEQKLKGLAPPALFCKGDLRLLEGPCISVVGSRKILQANAAFASRIGEIAAQEGYTLVSGGAAGADSLAQDACLQNGGKVIEFTPERLDKKKQNPNVLYCSEYGWDMSFSAYRALDRNRLIHAMSEKTFVAQCQLGRGGSWRGAEENLKNGYSTVFVFWDGSAGAAGLLERGAIEISEAHSLCELQTGQIAFL